MNENFFSFLFFFAHFMQLCVVHVFWLFFFAFCSERAFDAMQCKSVNVSNLLCKHIKSISSVNAIRTNYIRLWEQIIICVIVTQFLTVSKFQNRIIELKLLHFLVVKMSMLIQTHCIWLYFVEICVKTQTHKRWVTR